jgi:hypothetical protein
MADYTFIDISRAHDRKHYYIVTLINNNTGKRKHIKFGNLKKYYWTDWMSFPWAGIEVARKKKNGYIKRVSLKANFDNPLQKSFWILHMLWSRIGHDASLDWTRRQLSRLGYL